VLPFIAGWPAPGVIREGVSKTPRLYVGGSAGQGSLIQALDMVFGIDHGSSKAAPIYVRDMRRYMPTGHRRFVRDVERLSQMRKRAMSGSASQMPRQAALATARIRAWG
jgi:indoleamine 2,3-dioxygenase